MWKPFSSGTQFADWRENNCKQCTKGYDSDWHCDIEYALDLAYITDGRVSDDIANRMGKDEEKYLWICPERSTTMEIINLTPHTITVIYEEDGQTISREFEPSGLVARVTSEQKIIRTIDNIPVVKTEFGKIENLPEREEGKIYIVSSLVAQAASGRSDVVAPDTGPTAYRDDSGKIVAVRRFQQF